MQEALTYDEVREVLILALATSRWRTGALIDDLEDSTNLVEAMRMIDKRGRHWCDRVYHQLERMDESPARDYVLDEMEPR